MGVSKISY